MFERFTDRARRVLVDAQDEARSLSHSFIGPEHILLGLIRGEGVAAKVLGQLGVSLDEVREKVAGVIAAEPGGGPHRQGALQPSGQEGPRNFVARGASPRP